MANKHAAWDLAQMQSLPLEAKIRMTQDRIRVWYESWKRYEIFDKATNKVRFVTACEEPVLKDTEYIDSVYDGQVYVSLSGGKDSTVLKHIVDSMYDDVPAVFVNTGLEYPEIQKFVKDIKAGKFDCFNSDVEIVRPEMRFDEVLKKYGYPAISKEVAQKIVEAKSCPEGVASQSFDSNSPKIQKYGSRFDLSKWKFLFDAEFNVSHMCCAVNKKKPAKHYEKQTGRKAIIGTMASESRLRKTNWMRFGCNAFEMSRPTSQPLSFWTDQDILHYIKKYNVPYCSVYGDIVIDAKVDGENVLEGQVNLIDYLGCYEEEDRLKTTGCDRTGCIFCMFGCHLEKEPNRFQRLKETHPRQYEYCINGGEYVWEIKHKDSLCDLWSPLDLINDDGSPMTNEQIEEFYEKYKNDDTLSFKKTWQPSKEGLGLGKVLDYIGVKYE